MTEAPAALALSDAQYAEIAAVNAQVNTEHEYQTDASGYHIGDYWTIMGAGDPGDCEDFALTKQQALIDAGYNAKNLQLAWGYTETGGGHAFLLIQSNRGTLVLDNRYQTVMQLENVPYRVQGYQRAGQTWANFTTKLEAVPIEYMSCNAAAFSDGDAVLVKFEGQDWSSPKVIGFKENPAACEFSMYAFWGNDPSGAYEQAFKIDLSTQVAAIIATYQFLNPFNREAVASFKAGASIHLVGGYAQNITYGLYEQSAAVLNNNTQYNTATGVYAEKTEVPAPVRSMSAGFSLGAYGYSIGGGKYFDPDYVSGYLTGNVYPDNDQYYPTTDAWSAKTDCPLSRMGARGFAVNGKLHILNGHDDFIAYSGPGDGNNVQSGHTAFDPDADSWQSMTDIDEPRTLGNHCAIGDNGYAFGGFIFTGAYSTATQIDRVYTPGTDTWALISHPVATSGFQQRFGRQSNQKGYIASSARIYYEYTPETDSYVQQEGSYLDPYFYRFKPSITGEIA